LFALTSLLILTPFVSGVLLGSSSRAHSLAGRHYWPLIGLGWIGVVLVLLGAIVLHHPLSLIALAVGGPLSGLSFWSRRESGGDDGGGGDGRDDDPEPPPPGDDWERIVREFERDLDGHRGPITDHSWVPRRRRSRTPDPPRPTRI
jgi:hypothetical protein